MGHKQYCVLPPPGRIRIRLGPCRTFLCFKSAYITDIPVCENPTFTAGLNDSALKMETERHLQIRDFVRKLVRKLRGQTHIGNDCMLPTSVCK